MIDPAARRDRGFAMVALLIGMSVAAIWMTAALPAWRQQAQRQKEEDLIFRGEQYARAIVLYMAKNRGAAPPTIDTLVEQRFLRKKWKDPITNLDFLPVGIGVSQPGSSQLPGSSQALGPAPGRGSLPVTAPGRGGPQTSAPGPIQQGQTPGITGVRSQSTATSIKIYQNQQQYNMWAFDAALMRARMGIVGGNQPGGNQPGRGNPGDPGRQVPGGQPGRGGPGGFEPGRGGGPVGPGAPVGPGGPVGGRTGGSF